jgi:hypothetical protein
MYRSIGVILSRSPQQIRGHRSFGCRTRPGCRGQQQHERVVKPQGFAAAGSAPIDADFAGALVSNQK